MASLAQFAFKTVRDGLSARAGLAMVREAGLRVRDAVWFRQVGEARAHYSGRLSEMTRPLNRRPTPQEVTAIPTRVNRGFRQYVDIWVRAKGSDEVTIVSQALVTQKLVSRARAVDMAIAGYRRAQARRQVTGATLTTLPDAEILGGIYTATLEFMPEDEFAPQ